MVVTLLKKHFLFTIEKGVRVIQDKRPKTEDLQFYLDKFERN